MKLRPIRFYQKYQELRARIKANSCPVLPATPASGGGVGVGGVIGGVNTTVNSNYSVQRSASLKDHRQLRYVFFANVCNLLLVVVFDGCNASDYAANFGNIHSIKMTFRWIVNSRDIFKF